MDVPAAETSMDIYLDTPNGWYEKITPQKTDLIIKGDMGVCDPILKGNSIE